MKKTLVALASLLILLTGVFVLHVADTCSDWQDRCRRFLYSEMIKNSPFIYTPEMIDEIIGERPAGCDRPTTLSTTDVRRYRREGVGPNEFLEERRARSQ
jgi:hypothetical protein